MIHFKNVKTLEGKVQDKDIPSDADTTVDCEGRLLLMPSIIDPSPKLTLSETALLKGGITTVFQPVLSKTIRIKPYLQANPSDLMDIVRKKKEIAGVTIEFGPNDYSLDNEEALNQLFRLLAQENLIGVISLSQDAERTIAITSDLVEKYDAQLFFPNISTFEQLQQINEAKKKELWIFTGITANALLTSKPLLDALKHGNFDVICTQGQLPSFLKAHKDESLNLTDFTNFTRTNVDRLFVLDRTEDVVVVDLESDEVIYVAANGKLINVKELP